MWVNLERGMRNHQSVVGRMIEWMTIERINDMLDG